MSVLCLPSSPSSSSSPSLSLSPSVSEPSSSVSSASSASVSGLLLRECTPRQSSMARSDVTTTCVSAPTYGPKRKPIMRTASLRTYMNPIRRSNGIDTRCPRSMTTAKAVTDEAKVSPRYDASSSAESIGGAGGNLFNKYGTGSSPRSTNPTNSPKSAASILPRNVKTALRRERI